MDEFEKAQKIYQRIKKEPGFDPNDYIWEIGSKTMNNLLKKYYKFLKKSDGTEPTTLFGISIRTNYVYLNHLELYKRITDDINIVINSNHKSLNFYKNVTEGK